MKFCQYCGAEVHEEAVVCVHCGRSIDQPKKSGSQSNANTLITIAKVFMIISCAGIPAFGLLYGLIMLATALATATTEIIIAAVAFLIGFCIPLAWMLPLTINVHNKSKNHEPIGVGIKVCTLLFVNVVAGILLLCANDEE